MHALPLAMLLIFGAPSFSAMTPTLWALFALNNVGTPRRVARDIRTIDALAHSPQFRAWAAANGERAIKLQPAVRAKRKER